MYPIAECAHRTTTFKTNNTRENANRTDFE